MKIVAHPMVQLTQVVEWTNVGAFIHLQLTVTVMFQYTVIYFFLQNLHHLHLDIDGLQAILFTLE